MSYGYQDYGGNPYGSTGQSGYGYGSSNPYGSTGQGRYDAPNAHGQDVELGRYDDSNSYSYGQQTGAPLQNQFSESSDYSKAATPGTGGAYGGYTQPGQQEYANQQPTTMNNREFLSEVERLDEPIKQLRGNVTQIDRLYQQNLTSAGGDSGPNPRLEAEVANTRTLMTRIKNDIKRLEKDAARTPGDTTKESQVRVLKTNFGNILQQYQKDEFRNQAKNREEFSRQYKIANPQASDAEVRQAEERGDQNVFLTSTLQSNRQGEARTALSHVRARHNDIKQIEATLTELAKMFEELKEQVIVQEAPVQQIENQTARVEDDTRQGNTQLDRGIDHARRARKLKWICFGIVCLILIIIALVLGIYFGVVKK